MLNATGDNKKLKWMRKKIGQRAFLNAWDERRSQSRVVEMHEINVVDEEKDTWKMAKFKI